MYCEKRNDTMYFVEISTIFKIISRNNNEFRKNYSINVQ